MVCRDTAPGYPASRPGNRQVGVTEASQGLPRPPSGNHVSMQELDSPDVAALLEHGTEQGHLALSEVEELAERLELEGNALEDFFAELDRHWIDVSDDASRTNARSATWVNGELASSTTDALQLFLNE